MSEAPEFIGKYRVVRHLGEGGMGNLYLAEDRDLDRFIAIKVLKEDSTELRERFVREARTAARLKHPNIVLVLDWGHFEGQPFIAMEYVDGETLAQMIKRRAAITLTRKLTLIKELCSGLYYAHRAGVIHRDIKPANIMVDSEGTLKILDFGIARLQSSDLTRAGAVMGTLNYMSPELVSGQVIDHRSDVFAVGAVLYELLSFRKAFPGSLPDVLGRILYREPDGLEGLVQSLGGHPDLLQIIGRSLEKNSNARYPDLVTMGKDLALVCVRIEKDEELASTIPIFVPTAEQPFETEKVAAFVKAVDRARAALELANIDGTRAAIDEARRLNPDGVEIPELEHRLSTLVNRGHAHQAINEGRQLLADGILARALELARRAEALAPGEPEVRVLLGEIERAQSEQERQQIRRQTISEGLIRARAAYDEGAFDLAARAAADVLALDPENDTARALSAKAAEAIERRRLEEERIELSRRVAETIAEARRWFTSEQRAAALDLLATFQPAHVEITAVLDDLRAQSAAIDLQAAEEAAGRQKADGLVERGRASLDAGNTAAAMECAIDAMHIVVDHAGARSLAQAVEDVLEAERRAAAAAFVEQCQAEFRSGRHQAALDDLRKYRPTHSLVDQAVAKLEATWADIRTKERETKARIDTALRLARQELELSRFESTIKHAEAILNEDPDNVDALEIRDRAVKALELHHRAQDEQRRAEDAVRQARSQFQEGQHDQAIRHLEQYQPAHALTTAALVSLRRDLAARERKQQEQAAAIGRAIDQARQALARGSLRKARRSLEAARGLDAAIPAVLELSKAFKAAEDLRTRERRQMWSPRRLIWVAVVLGAVTLGISFVWSVRAPKSTGQTRLPSSPLPVTQTVPAQASAILAGNPSMSDRTPSPSADGGADVSAARTRFSAALGSGDAEAALLAINDAIALRPNDAAVQSDLDLLLSTTSRNVARALKRVPQPAPNSQAAVEYQKAIKLRNDATALIRNRRKAEAVRALIGADRFLKNAEKVESVPVPAETQTQPGLQVAPPPVPQGLPEQVKVEPAPPPAQPPAVVVPPQEKPDSRPDIRPPVVPPDDPSRADREAIAAVIQRYLDAYEHMDSESLRSIWPSMPSELTRELASVRSYKLSISNVVITLTGTDSARVTCVRTITTRPAVGRERTAKVNTTILLLRAGQAWRIGNVQ